jgi:hypothetical protein
MEASGDCPAKLPANLKTTSSMMHAIAETPRGTRLFAVWAELRAMRERKLIVVMVENGFICCTETRPMILANEGLRWCNIQAAVLSD